MAKRNMEPLLLQIQFSEPTWSVNQDAQQQRITPFGLSNVVSLRALRKDGSTDAGLIFDSVPYLAGTGPKLGQ
jgi:hypothetical protein